MEHRSLDGKYTLLVVCFRSDLTAKKKIIKKMNTKKFFCIIIIVLFYVFITIAMFHYIQNIHHRNQFLIPLSILRQTMECFETLNGDQTIVSFSFLQQRTGWFCSNETFRILNIQKILSKLKRKYPWFR